MATAGNQWMSYPGLPNFGNPTSKMQPAMNPGDGMSTGTSPFGGGGGGTPGVGSPSGFNNYPLNPVYTSPTSFGLGGTSGPPGGGQYQGHGIYGLSTYSPAYTGQYYGMLDQLLGQGGGLQNNLLNFLMGGGSTTPGMNQLGGMAQTGDPISAMPEWQAMLQAQKQNIEQNQAGLKEQFGAAGELQSSPFGTAMSNYMQQTTKDQNAMLADLERQSMESAMQRQMQTGLGISGLAGGESQFLNQLLSGGAFAAPGVSMKGQNSLIGGIGSLVAGIGGMGTGGGGTVAGDLLSFLGLG